MNAARPHVYAPDHALTEVVRKYADYESLFPVNRYSVSRVTPIRDWHQYTSRCCYPFGPRGEYNAAILAMMVRTVRAHGALTKNAVKGREIGMLGDASEKIENTLAKLTIQFPRESHEWVIITSPKRASLLSNTECLSGSVVEYKGALLISDGTPAQRNEDGTLKDGFIWGDDVAVLTAAHNVQFQFYKRYTAHEEYAALRKTFLDVDWPEVDLPAPTWDGTDRMLVESKNGGDDGALYRILEDYSAFQSFPQSTYVFRW